MTVVRCGNDGRGMVGRAVAAAPACHPIPRRSVLLPGGQPFQCADIFRGRPHFAPFQPFHHSHRRIIHRRGYTAFPALARYQAVDVVHFGAPPFQNVLMKERTGFPALGLGRLLPGCPPAPPETGRRPPSTGQIPAPSDSPGPGRPTGLPGPNSRQTRTRSGAAVNCAGPTPARAQTGATMQLNTSFRPAGTPQIGGQFGFAGGTEDLLQFLQPGSDAAVQLAQDKGGAIHSGVALQLPRLKDFRGHSKHAADSPGWGRPGAQSIRR